MDVYVFPQVSMCGIAQYFRVGAIIDQSSRFAGGTLPSRLWMGMVSNWYQSKGKHLSSGVFWPVGGCGCYKLVLESWFQH
jgi:hypothetical protein